MARFYQQIYSAVERHFDFDQLKAIIIASAGFTKESIMQYIMEEAQVYFSLFGKENMQNVTTFTEIFKQGNIDSKIEIHAFTFVFASCSRSDTATFKSRGTSCI